MFDACCRQRGVHGAGVAHDAGVAYTVQASLCIDVQDTEINTYFLLFIVLCLTFLLKCTNKHAYIAFHHLT